MDRKSKTFFIILTLAVFSSIAASFYRYVVLNNYVTYTDPDTVPSAWDIFKQI